MLIAVYERMAQPKDRPMANENPTAKIGRGLDELDRIKREAPFKLASLNTASTATASIRSRRY